MEELMYFVDCYRDETIIHRFNLATGRYLPPKKVRGVFIQQAMDLLWMAKRDICTKIIFDEMGVGIGLKQAFIKEVHYDSDLKMDEHGNITSPYYDYLKNKPKEEKKMTDWRWHHGRQN